MTSEPQEIGGGRNLAAKSPEIDFALVLSRVIGSIKDDPAQLRNAVYELARIKLQREGWYRNPPMNILEMRRLMLALESAIERVETFSSKYDELRALQSLDRLIESSGIGASKMIIEPREPLRIINQAPERTDDVDHLPAILPRVERAPLKRAPLKRAPLNPAWFWHWPGSAPLLRGAMIAIVGVALSVVIGRQFGLFGRQAPQPAAPIAQKHENLEPKSVVRAPGPALQSPATMLQPQAPAFPLPDVYGVYAVSGGNLHELEALVGRVPDPRVLMSTSIKTPSRTVLPDGRIVFIVYRRDVVSSAPERVTVR